MNIKTIVLVIVVSATIGVIIVFAPKFLQQSGNPSNSNNSTIQQSNKTAPTPTPIPTTPPPIIDKNTNLKDEVSKMKVPDFVDDFTKLKSELE